MENNSIVIKNVASMDFNYVYMQQMTSHNGGADFDVTAEWKFNRDGYRAQQAMEWVAIPVRTIPFIEVIPAGCMKVEF